MSNFPKPNVPTATYIIAKPVPKSPEEVAALSLNAAARSLPDEDFADEPAVVRAAENVAAWKARLQRLATYSNKRGVIQALIDGLAAELEAAREAYRFASLDDFLRGDHDFVAAIVAGGHVRLIEQRLQAAQVAKVDVDRSPIGLTELQDLAARAMEELGNTRFELKMQAALAHRTQ